MGGGGGGREREASTDDNGSFGLHKQFIFNDQNDLRDRVYHLYN